MEVRHEIIAFDRDNPIKLFIHKLGDVSRHWHESLELLFVLVGEVSVLAGSEQMVLGKEDIFLINSNTPHELHAEECVIIALQIKLSKFNLPEDLVYQLFFDCNSVTAPAGKDFRPLKRLITKMIQTNAAKKDDNIFENRALAYSLLSELVQNFKVKKPTTDSKSRKHLERLSNIIRYINTHYQDQLTLNQLAEHEHLSPPYLSSFFEKHMGINFSTYYTNVRLDHALHDLVFTDSPVEQIAYDSGFTDARAFVRAFKKQYNMLPNAYRKNAAYAGAKEYNDPLLLINYLDFKPENYFDVLTQYLELPEETPSALTLEKVSMAIGKVDITCEKQKLKHSWRTLIGVGRAKELLLRQIQEQLTQLQQEVGFRYVRFHGIFSDDMLVCKREPDGTLKFSFTLIDMALDFVCSIGLKPLIQFSFMPGALAAEPEHHIFDLPFIISPPAKMEEWNQLVCHFLEHVRYGVTEIRSWLFSVWNEPDTSPNLFGFARPEQFYAFYETTYKKVKRFDEKLVFGSPSMFPINKPMLEWMKGFLNYTQKADCIPEFIDIHYYSEEFNVDQRGHDSANIRTTAQLSSDPDHFSKFLDALQSILRQELPRQLPLYITEWNLTVSHRNLINDTCFKGCYLAKNLLENYDRVDAVGYWSLSDLLEESMPEKNLFHGGMGLFTQNGIKKPPYYVMTLLARLGDMLICSGNGYFVTRRGNQIQALLYNYIHFDPFFVEEGIGMTEVFRSGAFPSQHSMDVSFTLSELEGSVYRVRETILNQAHGSAFDRWVKCGAQPMGHDDANWLRQTAVPSIHICQAVTTEGELNYNVILAPHEVRFVEFIPIEDGYVSR